MVARPAGVLRLGRRSFGPSQLLVMAAVPAGDPAVAMEWVHAVVAEGADIVGVPAWAGGEAGEREEIGRVVPFIAAVRDAYPELAVVASTRRREVAQQACTAGAAVLGLSWGGSGSGLAEVAAEFGAGVVGPPGLAERAVAAGVEPGRVIVEMESGGLRLPDLVATGWPVMVSLPDGDLAGGLATAAVGAWLGARVFGVPWVRETARALRMVSAIRGDIAPACAVRGLALAVFCWAARGRIHLSRAARRPVANYVNQGDARPGPVGPAAQSRRDRSAHGDLQEVAAAGRSPGQATANDWPDDPLTNISAMVNTGHPLAIASCTSQAPHMPH